MVKVIVQLYPQLPAKDEAERIALRPIGRNSELYQDVLVGWHDIVRAADEMGVWGASTIEHHFHSEGYEVGPCPGILCGYWAAMTKNIRMGQLGYPMSTHNPIRVAEETAILDHLTKGRCFIGFSRGYQSRWTDVYGQHFGGVATRSDGGDDDKKNRDVFEEHVDLVIRAWTQESIEHCSERWQVPYPHAEGNRNWPMSDWTAMMGAEGEIGPEGEVRRVSVVPAPYTKPHPPVFVASNASIETVEYAGRRAFVPAYFSSIGRASHYGPTYTKAANDAGHDFQLGQNQAIVRWPRMGETRQEGLDMLAEYDGDIYKHFYEVFNPPYIRESHPLDPNCTREDTVDPMLKSGLFVAGSLAEVRDEYIAQWKQLPAEYAVLIFHYAQQPKESVIQQLELFMTEIKPALDELTPYADGEG